MAETPTYDAIVVGAGAGGATLTHRLSARGLRVLVVEQGDYLDIGARAPDEPVGKFIYHWNADTAAPIHTIGGRTKFYGAALYRMRESDFEEVQHESGVSPAWPFSYAELEPYYEQAEKLYRVHGGPDGDPSEPRRASPYPHPPLPHDPLVAEVVEKLNRAGLPTAPIPRGIDYGDGGACVLCATCDAHYCRLDAKMDADTAAMRPALKTGRVTLRLNTECLAVLTSADGTRATGVRLRTNGVTEDIAAPIVVVSCGIPGSALLLRRSRNAAHPQGLGNAHGMLGKYFGGHSSSVMFPILSLRPLGPRHTKTFAINAYYEGAPDWPYPLGTIQVAGQTPFWDNTSRLKRPFIQFVGERSLACFYMSEALPTAETGFDFDGDKIAKTTMPVANPKTFKKLAALAAAAFRKAGFFAIMPNRHDFWHEVGTARLGDDPRTSVTDPMGMVHGIEGLYVADASILPSAGAVNTGLTIAALALRTGDAIADKAGVQR